MVVMPAAFFLLHGIPNCLTDAIGYADADNIQSIPKSAHERNIFFLTNSDSKARNEKNH